MCWSSSLTLIFLRLETIFKLIFPPYYLSFKGYIGQNRILKHLEKNTLFHSSGRHQRHYHHWKWSISGETPQVSLKQSETLKNLLQKLIKAYMEPLTEYDTGLRLICKLITRANKQNSRIGKNLLLNVEVDWHFFCISRGGRTELKYKLLDTFGC